MPVETKKNQNQMETKTESNLFVHAKIITLCTFIKIGSVE